jgi:hypothetical protein
MTKPPKTEWHRKADPKADISMAFVLPGEWRAVEEDFVRLNLGTPGCFPEEHRHLKSLYMMKGVIDGKPMLVDGGATVNRMPYNIFKKLGKDEVNLLVLNNFVGRTRIAGQRVW